ncbi:tripartite motif-containing protein 2-like, partial [Branchiostoma floridae x Branchiostoma belcheri]
MAAAFSALGSKIREDLSCSICLELFTRPKVLPCQHTFCQDCLQDHAGRGGTFQCPNCRQKVRLPPKGVASLPDNRLVTSLCEKVQQQATLSGETTELRQPQNRCGFHSSEKLKLYCKPCRVPICELCLEETHDDHLTTTIKKAAQERRSTVQTLINEGRNILESYCGFVRGLGEEEKTLNEQIQAAKHGIVQAYNQMVQKLAEQKDQLLAEAEQNKSKNLESIDNGREGVLADVSELSAA